MKVEKTSRAKQIMINKNENQKGKSFFQMVLENEERKLKIGSDLYGDLYKTKRNGKWKSKSICK